MTTQPSSIQKAIFQALELAFQAEVYNQRQQLPLAYSTYVQAAKVFIAVIEKCPHFLSANSVFSWLKNRSSNKIEEEQ